MSTYAENKARARTRNTTPSQTDQSQAKDTDINVIIGRYGISGRVPTTQHQPMAGDFSNLPDDLRGFIETAKTLRQQTNALPEKLRDLPVDQLLALTPEQLTNILKPEPTPVQTEENK